MADEQSPNVTSETGTEPTTDSVDVVEFEYPGLAGELAEYRGLAEQRAERLQQRDAELADLRQAVETHRAAAEAAQTQVLETHRRALLAEHRGGIVEDLIQGTTVEELNASVERAKAAYQSVAQSLRQQAAAQVGPGAGAASGPDLSSLSPQEKIAHALRSQQR